MLPVRAEAEYSYDICLEQELNVIEMIDRIMLVKEYTQFWDGTMCLKLIIVKVCFLQLCSVYDSYKVNCF